jgi:hypothetical protein
MSKVRETLGSQILKCYEKNHDEIGPECREVVLEYGHKEWLPRLQKILQEEAPKFNKKFYILVVGYKDPLSDIASHVRIIVRGTKPLPEPKTMVYSYDPQDGLLMVEWTLPSDQTIKDVLNNPDDYDPFLADCVFKYKNKTL